MAIESIPAYVELSNFFVILCPWICHAEQDTMLSQHSWAQRPFCSSSSIPPHRFCSGHFKVVSGTSTRFACQRFACPTLVKLFCEPYRAHPQIMSGVPPEDDPTSAAQGGDARASPTMESQSHMSSCGTGSGGHGQSLIQLPVTKF